MIDMIDKNKRFWSTQMFTFRTKCRLAFYLMHARVGVSTSAICVCARECASARVRARARASTCM